MSSVFEEVEQAPPIEVFHLTEQFKECTKLNKVNLTVGAYRTDEGKPWVLPVVRTVESQLASDESLQKDYLPITGMADFCSSAVALCFGDGHRIVLSQRADGVQAAGGTGALRIGLDFLHQVLHCSCVLISSPTWGNHRSLAQQAGFTDIRQYRYWQHQQLCLDEAGMLEDLESAPVGSVVILHGVAHNPTGCDPTEQQWQSVLSIVQQRGLIPLVDLAYQGFATGDLDSDAKLPRLLADNDMEFFVAQSFSKNFGLYNERVGNLAIVTKSAEITGRVKSQLRDVNESTIGNPANHGARIVATVLRNPALLAEWKDNVRRMADRIKMMRQMLYQKLRSLGTPGSWQHIITQVGMFSFTGLSSKQVEYIREEYGIFMMSDGRINIAALTSSNVDRVAQAIHEAASNREL